MSRNMHVRPVKLGDNGQLLAEGLNDYLHVVVTGRFDNDKEAYIYGIGPEGQPVYHVVVPFKADDGETFLVDRGIVPQHLKAAATRPAGIRRGETMIVGYWRWPQAPGIFTPKPDAAKRVWYSKDVVGIARAEGIKLADPPGIIEADSTPNPGGWPKGGQTVVTFRNDHLQYAITWFALAAVTLGGWIAYHISQGRLGRKQTA